MNTYTFGKGDLVPNWFTRPEETVLNVSIKFGKDAIIERYGEDDQCYAAVFPVKESDGFLIEISGGDDCYLGWYGSAIFQYPRGDEREKSRYDEMKKRNTRRE